MPPSGHLRSGEASIDIRTRQKEHTRKQRELEELMVCESEVPAMLTLERNGINFIITGRADLLTGDRRVIEIKTAQPLPEKPAGHHALQALFTHTP